MPMNPLPPAGATGAAPTASAGPGQKEDAAAPDSAFTALLMALMGAQVIAPAPAPEQNPGAQSGNAVQGPVQAPALSQAPPEDAAAPTGAVLPEEIETLLNAQRVVTAPEFKAEAESVPAAGSPPEGAWVVEPIAPEAVSVPAVQTGLPENQAQPGDPKAQDEARVQSQRKAPLSAAGPRIPDMVAFAPEYAATAHRPDVAAPAVERKAPPAIPSPIEPDRLMDAIAKSAVSAGDGKYTVTLRLHPEQLGEVRLQLHVAGREVQTSLQVTNPAAQQLLEQRSDQLREGLSQSGLTLAGFHVATGQQERQRQTEQPFEQMAPRRRNRQEAGAGPIGGVAPRPVPLRGNRPTVGLDTLA